MKIMNVSFSEDSVEVTYGEDHEAGKDCMLIRLIVVKRSLIEEQLAELDSTLHEVIDEGLVSIRNPPTSIGD